MANVLIETLEVYFKERDCKETFELFLNKAYDYKSFDQVTRKEYLDNAVILYKHDEELQDKYDYYPKARKYSERFVLKGSQSPIFEDGINYTAPNKKGLYFVGETHFNPFTDEKFYWVKIGRGVNLKNRLRDYDTHNPMLWRIDFSTKFEKEEWYHKKLNEVAIAKCNHNKEWFLVDRTTYLEMCEKGFKFFE